MPYQGEIIEFEQTENYIKLAIPKKSRRKHSDLKLVDRDKGVYEVAKSNVYEYGKQKLGDGSVVTVMRLKAVPYEERVTRFKAAAPKLISSFNASVPALKWAFRDAVDRADLRAMMPAPFAEFGFAL